jgi:hypothetical protein
MLATARLGWRSTEVPVSQRFGEKADVCSNGRRPDRVREFRVVMTVISRNKRPQILVDSRRTSRSSCAPAGTRDRRHPLRTIAHALRRATSFPGTDIARLLERRPGAIDPNSITDEQLN